MALRVVGYVRVSTEEQYDSGAGLEAQRAQIRDQAARRSWLLTGIREDAASGKSLATRPGLQLALREIEEGGAEALVVAKLAPTRFIGGDGSQLPAPVALLLRLARQGARTISAYRGRRAGTRQRLPQRSQVLGFWPLSSRRLEGAPVSRKLPRGKAAAAMSLLIQHAGDGEMGGRDRAIVWTLLGCGLRRQELSSLRVSGDIYLSERRLHVQATTSKSVHPRDVTISIEVLKELDVYIGDHRSGADPEDPLFTDRHGRPLAGTAIRKLFERLKARTGIRGLCAHMLRHTWATHYHRSGSGSRLDLQVEGGWTTGRMVERYCKARPFEERCRAPSVFTAWRAGLAGKRPSGKRPPQQESVLDGKRIA